MGDLFREEATGHERQHGRIRIYENPPVSLAENPWSYYKMKEELFITLQTLTICERQ